MLIDVADVVPEQCLKHFRGYDVGVRMAQNFISKYTYPDGTEVIDPIIMSVKESYAYMSGLGTIPVDGGDPVTFKVLGSFHFSPGSSDPDGVAVYAFTPDTDIGRKALMLLRLSHGIGT